MKIAIVENDKKDVELLINYLNKYFSISKKTEGMKLRLFTYSNGLDFLESSETFDVVFMDIEMPIMDGIKTSYKLREKDKDVTLVFVTNIAQYAIEGYKVKATDFCLKPITFPDITIIMDSIVTRFVDNKDTYFIVKKSSSIIKIKQRRIESIEMNGHNVSIYYYKEGILKTVSFRSSMKMVNSKIEHDSIVAISSGAMINLRYVESYDNSHSTVKLKGGKILPISRAYKKDFILRFSRY